QTDLLVRPIADTDVPLRVREREGAHDRHSREGALLLQRQPQCRPVPEEAALLRIQVAQLRRLDGAQRRLLVLNHRYRATSRIFDISCCISTRRWNSPFFWISSSWVPTSSTLPSLSTTRRLALRRVL